MNSTRPKTITPAQNDRCCMPLYTPKRRAALLFDRQYLSAGGQLDEDIPEEVIFRIEDADAEYLASIVHNLLDIVVPPTPRPRDAVTAHVEAQIAQIMVGIYKRYGVNVVPLFSHAQKFDEYCEEGNHRLANAVLENVPVVDDGPLQWEQILEFRADKDAKRKLRDLHLWIQQTIGIQSTRHALDVVEQKLDDYRAAIQKHGFTTKVGVLKALLDWRGLLGDATAATVGAYLGGPVGAALTTGLTVSGQVIAFICDRKLALDEAQRANREIAILQDIAERVAAGTTSVRTPPMHHGSQARPVAESRNVGALIDYPKQRDTLSTECEDLHGFFADSTSLDYLALRPLSHIRPNWELMWDPAEERYVTENDSLAAMLNDLIEELESCEPPPSYHASEDRLAEFARDRLKWRIRKVGRWWVGEDYGCILEQGAFDDWDEKELVLAASGRIRAARVRGQNAFDDMEVSHRRMLASVIAVILYHRVTEPR